MNMFIRGTLLTILGFVIGFLLSSFLSHSWPFTLSLFETKTEDTGVVTEKKEEANIVEPRLTFVTVNDTECPVVGTIDNPFLSGEYIIETKDGCFSGTDSAFLFLKKKGEETKPLLTRGVYSYPFDNPAHEKEMPIVTFVSSNEVLYGSSYGEGAECQEGGTLIYNKLNLDTGEVTTLAEYAVGASCHNERALKTTADRENACMDETMIYTFENSKFEIKAVCEKAINPSNKILTFTLNNKKIREEPLPEGETYTFNGFTNTLNLLRKNKNVQFTVNGNPYSLNLDTGMLAS
ncbi:MAG: hypothetical protein KA052_01620 [Candidatus Pacebacteria bacterium]|nr:hypothetical protein [Candidatus Paceibacterota bacterium]